MEASIQEALLDQFQDLVTGRAVAAGAAGREGAPTSSAEKAAAELRPILAAFAAGAPPCAVYNIDGYIGTASRRCVRWAKGWCSLEGEGV